MILDPLNAGQVPTVTLARLPAASTVPAGTSYRLTGSFAADVTSIILSAHPGTNNTQVWKGEATSVSAAPAVALFPANAIITWNQVAS